MQCPKEVGLVDQCESVFQQDSPLTCIIDLPQASMDVNDPLLPGQVDLSELFLDAHDVLGDDFVPPCNMLR